MPGDKKRGVGGRNFNPRRIKDEEEEEANEEMRQRKLVQRDRQDNGTPYDNHALRNPPAGVFNFSQTVTTATVSFGDGRPATVTRHSRISFGDGRPEISSTHNDVLVTPTMQPQQGPARPIMPATGTRKGSNSGRKPAKPAAQARAPQDETREKRCGNCHRQGHLLAQCMGPIAPNGFIMGCPECNSTDHLYEQCRNYDADEHARNMLLKRQHRPQLGSSMLLTTLPEGRQPGGKWVGNMPWTTQFAKEYQDRDPNFWRNYAYKSNYKQDPVLARDHFWKSGGGDRPNTVVKHEVAAAAQGSRSLRRRFEASTSPEPDKRPKIEEQSGAVKAEPLTLPTRIMKEEQRVAVKAEP